jgi:hypothetical protein
MTDVVYAASFGENLFFIVFSICLLIAFAKLMQLLEIRRTKHYREEVCDMYVAGKTRKYATADGINLDDEKKNFLQWNKKRNIRTQVSLDNAIEQDLKEKISEDKEKKK